MSSRCCQRCARCSCSSCKALSEIRQSLNSLSRDFSVKILANSSPSGGAFAGGLSASRSTSVQGRARKRPSLGKENLPNLALLEDEIQNLMNVPVEETETITKVSFANTNKEAFAKFFVYVLVPQIDNYIKLSKHL